MVVDIFLTMDDIEIGSIKFNITDKDELRGHVTSVRIDGDAKLKSIIETHLSSNPDRVSIAGGRSPTNIGTYGDGVYNVLSHLSQKLGFDYFGNMPILKIPDGFIF